MRANSRVKGILVALVCLLGLVGCSKEGETPEGSRLYGTVEIRTARLAFAESEIVTSVLVEEGDRVEAGQVLAALRSGRLKAQLAAMDAQLKAQSEVVRRLENGARPEEIARAAAEVVAREVAVENAAKDFERAKQTVDSGATTQQAYDQAESRYRQAEAELKAKQESLELVRIGARDEEIAQAKASREALAAQVDLLKLRIEDTELRAPETGTIESRVVEVGEMASPSRAAFVIALDRKKWVRAYLPEPLLGRVKPGQVAYIYSDSWPNERMEGQVGFISPTAEFTPKTVQTEELRTKLVYETRIWVEDPDGKLRLGMPVTVDVTVGTSSE